MSKKTETQKRIAHHKPANTVAPATTTAQVATVAPAPAATGAGTATPAKVRAVAVTQNGVARPRAGGLCDAIWVETERLLGTGIVPTVVHLRNFAITGNYNVNNAQIEFYRCMKFNGVNPRSARMAQVGATAPAESK